MADSSPPFQDGGELGQMASSGHMLQAKCKSPDPLASCYEGSSDQGPALPEDLQERGPMPSKDLSEQWEQALSDNAPKHGLTLPLQTPVTSANPSISPPLRPDHLASLNVSSSQPSDVASCDSENKSVVNKDAQINTLVSLQEALEEVSEPLELEPSLTSLSPVKIGIIEFNKKNQFALSETSEVVPGRSSSSTEKSVDIAEAMTENLTDCVAFPVTKVGTVDTVSPEKSNEIADSEFTTFSAAISAGEKCASVVSALTEKSPDGTETYEELLSDISLPSGKTLVDDIGQLQKCSVVDVMSPQPCLTLDTVKEPHLLKNSSSEGELVSRLDSREKPASLPIALFDHPSPLSSVSTDVICPLPSTKNSSSSVITVDTKLPYSSSQSSETDTNTPLMPSQKEKDELTQVGSESSGGQDVQEGFNIRSKKQDYMCGTQEGCELNLQANISLDEKLESGGISCVTRILDDSSVVNSDQEMQVEPGECWNDVDSSREESAMDTLPLIVDTHTLCHDDDEHSTVISNNAVSSSHLMSSSVLSSPQSSVSNVCTMPLLETEPLQPVTIGSSLQPLEEVQEASVLDDPSFAADLALIDSSADEADSIGGLVINSVIGAADGVVDFHPDEEMETDRELTDISASAPQIVEDACDNDSNDDNGPKAKRMRFENGVSDLDNKVQGTKKVIIRVTPVKNGHGLWDSHKLQEVLLAKGTILLRLHASTDALEMFETDKDEKEVDFTGIMSDSKDEDHDQILGLANLEPDADVYDPLAIVSTHSVDHASPPHYGRPFPHNRGRSTALQPAMSRPGFRHLQSPPHPHYYMKHEVLGLPSPLEFEEPQLGTTDWSGMDTPIVASPESQDPPDPNMAETTSSPSPKPVLVRKRVKKPDRVIRLKKVCEQCGKAFNKSSKYLQHLRTHRPLLQCDKCSFKTKDTKRFRIHGISHKKANPDVRCNICSELFATEVTQRIHKKKIHNIHGCKHCYIDYDSEFKLTNHLKEQHGNIKEKKGYARRSEDEYVKPINIFLDPPPTNEKRQFVCRLCNKETRNKYQLKIHIAQHLGVSSSKISDDFLLTQDVDNLIKEGLSSSSISSQDIKLENLVPICSMEVAPLKTELDASSTGNGIHSLSSVSKTDISSLSSYSSMNQSAASLTPKNPLLDSLPGASLISTIKQEHIEENSNEQDSDMDQEESSYSGGSAVFRCGLCALDFYAPTDLYQHAIKVHQIQNISQTQPSRQVNVSKRVKPSIPCDLCNVSCKSTKALRVHHRVKHRKIFTCPACHVSHKSIIRLLRHQRQIHKDKIRCRFQCSALFDTRMESIIHCRDVHNKEVKKVVCPYCEVEYQYEGNLINHLEKCKKCPPERRPAHVCGNCNEILPNIKEYNEHIKHCVLQKKKTDTVTKFKNKIINKGGVEYVELSDDDTVTKFKNKIINKGGVEYVELSDDDDDDDEDDDDDDGKSEVSLKLKKSLEIEEEQSEEVEGPQKCKYCPDKFTKEESAINHILAVHKNLITRMITEPQMCEVCGMIFKNQLCLCKHISKHYSDLSMWDVLVPPDILDVVKVKSYCWVCKSTLRGKISHHANMRNENIDKLLATEGLESQETERFHCPKCDDFFPTRSEFWEHVKVHLLELPKWSRQLSGPSSSDSCPNKITSTYECNECSLKFTNNSEFYRHLAVHFLEPYNDEIDSNNIDKDGSECEQIGSEKDVGDGEAEDDDFDLEGFMNPDAKYN